MPRPRSLMRKIKEVLRLTFGERLSRREVSAATALPYSTVSDHLARAAKAGIGWPLPEGNPDGRFLGGPTAALRQRAEQPLEKPWRSLIERLSLRLPYLQSPGDFVDDAAVDEIRPQGPGDVPGHFGGARPDFARDRHQRHAQMLGRGQLTTAIPPLLRDSHRARRA